MTAPRIGVNLLWLLPDAAGGAEEYAVRILHALDAVAGEALDVTLLCNRGFPRAHPELSGRFRTAVAPIDGENRAARIAAESTWLPREAARRRLHLVHHLNNVVPWVRNRPSVLTIHDLRPLELPETIGRAHGAYLRARFAPSVRAARAITTPSEFVRETVIERLGVPPERVHVVSAPVLPDAARPGERSPGTERILLYPAITNPHKNHRTLVEAFAKVAATHDDVVLVLTGAAGPAEPAVADAIGSLGLTGRVRRLGRVAPRDLELLYLDATGLVYPSTYEGFGLPLAEAMAAGCPVIAADRTALPEVVGDAGILVDPDDAAAWADAMRRLLDDDRLRSRLAAAGRKRVRAFSLGETARRQVAAYRQAVKGSFRPAS